METIISVIIPCYNCAKTIEETLKSVENSLCDKGEILLINDGSTDETLNIIQTYMQESNANIRVYSQDNAGVSVARNVGIKHSEGKYLFFLDSDDLLAYRYLDFVCQLALHEEVDTLFCLRTTKQAELDRFDTTQTKVENVSIQAIIEHFTISKKDIGFSCFFYKRDILLQNDVKFTEGAKYGEDWEFATKYLAHCKTAKKICALAYFYRICSSSVSRTISYAQTDAIEAAERTSVYLENIKHPFSAQFTVYMIPRTIFSVAHRFAAAKNKELFLRLENDYDVKQAMREMVKNKNVDYKSRMAACAYLIHRNLFFWISGVFS